jgi:hypothetical protein
VSFDNAAALERIEQAEHETPICWCGAPTVPFESGDAIWLRCTSLLRPRGTVRRLLTLDFAAIHVNRHILDLPASYQRAA